MTPLDFGPIYAETDLLRFPVEPWNTFSNIIFLFVIVHFAIATKFNIKQFPLTVVALPILTIGFIGGTIFHATRAHPLWLVMDWGPIVVLSILASIYFLRLMTNSFLKALIIPILFFVFFRIVMNVLPVPLGVRISIGYTTLAGMILIPAWLVASRLKAGRHFLGYSAMLFMVAISFRYLDSLKLLPMGTHFLWHIFGGASVFFLMKFIVALEKHVVQIRSE